MTKAAILTVATFVAAAFPQLAHAGSVSDATIVELRVGADAKGYAIFDKALADSPECIGAGRETNLAFDLNTEGGKAIYSTLLAAHVAGRRVIAIGTASCTLFTGVVGTENLSYMKLVAP